MTEDREQTATGTGRVSLIAALDENGVIGNEGAMPWHLPADLKHFKQLTMGKPIVMGRRTFEAIGKPLPGRRNIVLTRNTTFTPAGVQTAGSWNQAVGMALNEDEIMVIGGADIFRLTLPVADTLYLTVIETKCDGDTYFPEFARDEWELIDQSHREPDENNACAMTFQTLKRRPGTKPG